MRRHWLGALMVCLALIGPARATAPPQVDPEATVVQELVVQARVLGPAWWKVSKGDSVVWVLGVPAGFPKHTSWRQTALARRLTGARRLIVPADFTAGLGDLFGFLKLRGQLRAKTPIEATLPPELRARFLAAAARLGQSPRRYDSWKPAAAGLVMLQDFRSHAGFEEKEPVAAIRGLAQRRGVTVTPAASHRVLPVLRLLAGRLTETVNLVCLDDSLKEIEGGTARVRAAADAWTRGDVAGALTEERGFETCLASFPEFGAEVRETEAEEAAAIAHELKTPGVSVAAIPLRALLAEGGVLARLRAEGYEVKTPATDQGP